MRAEFPRQSTPDPVPELIELLRLPVVFIKWPRGRKGTRHKWGNLTAQDMTPEYLAKLKHGNIGVAAGEKSGGLCALDVDNDRFIEPLLSLNPALRDTLQTHGARGRVFWIRFAGDYPKRTTKLKTLSGEPVGEFRSSGAQSIIWGIHPDTGKPYTFVVKQPVIEVAFESIKWPSEISNPPTLAPCTEEPEEPEAPEEPEVIAAAWLFWVHTLEDALRLSLPDRPHENNDLIFLFARGIKALELQQAKFTSQQLRDAFDQWHIRAKPFLRPDQSKEEYWIEFLNAYKRAKYPLGSVIIPKAWKLANEQPLPAEALQFENPQLRLLVAFCRQLQFLNGSQPFYLSSRTCQQLFNHASHTTAAKWLRAICVLQIIVETEKGNEKRATRYRYGGTIETC